MRTISASWLHNSVMRQKISLLLTIPIYSVGVKTVTVISMICVSTVEVAPVASAKDKYALLYALGFRSGM